MIAELWRIPAYFLPLTPYPNEGERIDCPVCQNAESVTIAPIDRNFKLLNTVMCTRCGMVFSNPMPSEEELNDYYAVYGYLLNGLIVIFGTIFMAHFSFAAFTAQAIPPSHWIIKSLLPDIMIAWADFFVGKALYDFYRGGK